MTSETVAPEREPQPVTGSDESELGLAEYWPAFVREPMEVTTPEVSVTLTLNFRSPDPVVPVTTHDPLAAPVVVVPPVPPPTRLTLITLVLSTVTTAGWVAVPPDSEIVSPGRSCPTRSARSRRTH